MKFLISGASGYIGSALYQSLRREFGAEQVVGSFHEHQLFPELRPLSLESAESIQDLVREVRPDWVFHVGAIPSESGFLKDPTMAQAVNSRGTEILIEETTKVRGKFVFLSSEAITHDSHYGRSKLHGEEFLQSQGKSGWLILRPGTTYGISPNTTHPRPFNRLLQAALRGENLALDNSERFCLTWLHHLIEVCLLAVRRNILGEIIPVVLSQGATRFEIASALLKGTSITVSPIPGEEKDLAHLTQEKLKALGLPAYEFSVAVMRMREELELAVLRARQG